MYRVIAFSLFFAAGPAFAGTEATSPPLPGLGDAEIRPTIHPADDLVREAALLPVLPEPALPRLADRLAMAPQLIVRVDVGDQVMRVYAEGRLLHTWTVSTGRSGHDTPRGSWTPYRMHTMWHSRKYDNAPMPHSIFFHGGYAIHATPYVKRLGRPASHGCVRLHPDNAKELFALTKEYGRASMRVIVQN